MWNVESSEQTADTRLGSVTFVCETAEGCVCSLGELCVVATLVVRSADVRLLDWQCEFQSLWQFRRAKLTRGPPTLFCASATTPTQSVYKSLRVFFDCKLTHRAIFSCRQHGQCAQGPRIRLNNLIIIINKSL